MSELDRLRERARRKASVFHLVYGPELSPDQQAAIGAFIDAPLRKDLAIEPLADNVDSADNLSEGIQKPTERTPEQGS